MKLALVAATALTMVTAHSARAHSADDDTDALTELADRAGVSVGDLRGALNSQPGVDAEAYLVFDGALAPPAQPLAPDGWPIGGALGQRIFCIEAIESRHGAAMWNPVPVGRQHAQGYLGWLPSTAASVGVVIGDRASEWRGAAQMLALGRGREFAGIAWGWC